MIRDILVAYDHSRRAQHAFEQALTIARRTGARLIAVAVIRVPKSSFVAEIDDVLESARQRFTLILADLTARAREAGVRLTTEVVAGYPAEQILLLARQYQVDLIVLGGPSPNVLRRWLLGSVSQQVRRRAPCQALVVR